MNQTKLSKQQCESKHKKGFTLTEIAIVLGIIGLILGAIWVAAAGVYTNQKVAKANTQILTIAQAIRSLYGTSSTTGVAANTLATDTMITAGVFPSDTVTGAGAAAVTVNPWNGVIGVVEPAAGTTFQIEMNAVPQAACINLLLQAGGTGRDPGLVSAEGVANAVPAAGDAIAGATVPLATAITPAIAAAAAPNATFQGGCGVATTTKIILGFLVT